MALKNQAKRRVLIAQLNSKLSESNEKQLEMAINQHFKELQEEVLKNLEEYWNDASLLQGHINMILEPIENSYEAYYKILEKHIKKEYRLGENEAKRIVDIQNKHANKSERPRKWFFKKRRNSLFGTIDWSEEDLLQKTIVTSKRTLARITKELNQILTKGYTEGVGINMVANAMTTRFNQLETWEAKRIARTEIHNSHNRGVMKIYDEVGVEYTQWIAANDDRTRESHAEIDGEIIEVGGTYSNGLQYPGDTNGDIEEWINCRCSNAPFVIPYGYMAPPDKEQFYEDDLIPIK